MSFILEGNKFQERFLNLGATLEVMFNGDFRNKSFDKRFIKYDIAINRIDSRIGIEQVVVDGSKLQLMKDVSWDFIEEPHLLIGGGTGGGKTILLMSIIYALAKIGFIDICDPKNSDLSSLKKFLSFMVESLPVRKILSSALGKTWSSWRNAMNSCLPLPSFKLGRISLITG